MALSEKTSNAASTVAKADMAKAEHPADIERMMTDSQDDSSNAGTLNASGHRDALTRQYGLLGITGVAVAINNPWVVLGSSISVSICMFFSFQSFFYVIAYWNNPLTA